MQFRSIKHAGKRKESSHLRSTMQLGSICSNYIQKHVCKCKEPLKWTQRCVACSMGKFKECSHPPSTMQFRSIKHVLNCKES